MEEKSPYASEKMGTNFLGSTNSKDFVSFSHAMENWWGNPCISHILLNIIECESNWKKPPILWGKYDNQLSGSPHTMGFIGFSRKLIFHAFPIWWIFLLFPMPWQIDDKAYAYPIWGSIQQDGYLVKKSAHFMGKVWKPISKAFNAFQYATGNLMRKPMPFPYDKAQNRTGI